MNGMKSTSRTNHKYPSSQHSHHSLPRFYPPWIPCQPVDSHSKPSTPPSQFWRGCCPDVFLVDREGRLVSASPLFVQLVAFAAVEEVATTTQMRPKLEAPRRLMKHTPSPHRQIRRRRHLRQSLRWGGCNSSLRWSLHRSDIQRHDARLVHVREGFVAEEAGARTPKIPTRKRL